MHIDEILHASNYHADKTLQKSSVNAILGMMASAFFLCSGLCESISVYKQQRKTAIHVNSKNKREKTVDADAE